MSYSLQNLDDQLHNLSLLNDLQQVKMISFRHCYVVNLWFDLYFEVLIVV
jgi:hypothetical protein